MKASGLFMLAFRNVSRQRTRYLTLGSAIAFGFAIMIIVSGAVGGMTGNLERKAAIYYGGECTILGELRNGNQIIYDKSKLIGEMEKVFGGRAIISARYEYRSADTFLFFAGASVRQRILSGIDWERERELFGKLNFVAGGTGGMGGSEGILISEPAARLLGAGLGDDVLLLADNRWGQKTTANLVVKGIFRDSSLFGFYTAYVDYDFLISLFGSVPDSATQIGFSFLRPGSLDARADEIQEALESIAPVFPRVKTKAELRALQASEPWWDGVKYSVLSLDAHLYQINQIVGAIKLVLYGLIIILLSIILVGAANTFRVIVYERTREIGTMRAMGMGKRDLAFLFVLEGGMLAFASALVGFAFGLLTLGILSSFSFSWIPGFDVFLLKGRLTWSLGPSFIFLDFAAILITAVIAVSGPASSAARIMPAESLRTE